MSGIDYLLGQYHALLQTRWETISRMRDVCIKGAWATAKEAVPGVEAIIGQVGTTDDYDGYMYFVDAIVDGVLASESHLFDTLLDALMYTGAEFFSDIAEHGRVVGDHEFFGDMHVLIGADEMGRPEVVGANDDFDALVAEWKGRVADGCHDLHG